MKLRPLLLAALVVTAGCKDEKVVKAFEYVASAPIYSTPALTPEAVIFGSENGEVTALRRTGEFLWKYPTRREVVGAVKVASNMAFFGSVNNVFYALDLNGKDLWRHSTLARIKGDPLIVGDTVYFGSYDKHLYARDIHSGAARWTYPAPPAPPAEGTAPPAEGAPPPVEPMDAFSYSSPVLVGDMVVLGNLDGHLYAVDAKAGTLRWRFATDGAANNKGITSSVLETGDALVFGANDGHVYALSKDGQKVLWKFKTNDEVNATTIADEKGNLFVGGVDQTFYALDAQGKERWRFSAKGPVMGRAALVKNLVVFGGGSGDGTVYAVDRDSGKLVWSSTTGGKIEADMVADGDRVYVASGDRRLYCFHFNKI